MNKGFSLAKLIKTDYVAFISALTPLILCGIYLVVPLVSKESWKDNTILLIYGAMVVLSLGLFIWRIQVFRSVFNDGIETLATLISIYYYRGRGRLQYTYSYLGQEYTARNIVNRIAATRALTLGQQVVVLVDPSNPKRALIRDLYQ
jgi:hypothetical protein